MPELEGAHVALFIDWDNLAISTAADHGGALPDLRRIVQVAQSYGTVLLARAYAEWGITSERLAVYRAGVEPVYAPTFRFEADIPGQPPRGKSLADPCLVADCIDMLHLHPGLSTLVVVSGDKDLIPIVRLAQLRGKKVVVIGPDLVAAVLRDMADEYVPYRSLVAGSAEERSAHVRAEAAELGRRRRRRGRGGRGIGGDFAPANGNGAASQDDEGDEEIAPPAAPPPSIAPPPPPPARHDRRERRPFADRAGVFRPGAADQANEPLEPPTGNTSPTEPPRPLAPPEPPARPAPPAVEPAARAPAAEPARAPAAEAAPARPPTPPTPSEPSAIDAASPASQAETPAGSADLGELFTAITTILRERTSSGRPRLRATNLKDHLLARDPRFSERSYGFARFKDLLQAAESNGVLSITEIGQVAWIALPGTDAAATAPASSSAAPPSTAAVEPAATVEPAAVEPAAPAAVEALPPRLSIDPSLAVATLVELRHRSRLLTQNFVTTNLTALVVAQAPDVPADVEGRRLLDRLVEDGIVRIDREPQEVELHGAKHRVRLCHLADDHPAVQRAEEAWHAMQPAAAAEPPAEGESEAPSAESAPPSGDGASAVPAASANGSPAAAPAGESDADRLSGAFAALVEAVQASIAPGKETAGAAGVKSRLTRALGTFNERDFGYSKFKDFLLAAEKAGRVRVEVSGAATRVGLPAAAS